MSNGRRKLDKYQEPKLTLHEKFQAQTNRVLERKIVVTDPRVEKRLLTPKEIIHGFIRAIIDDGTKQDFECWRIHYNGKRTQGGTRYAKDAHLGEVVGLGSGMMQKNELMQLILEILGRKIHVGGGKGAVAIDTHAHSLRVIEDVSRGYIHILEPYIGSDKDGLAPDVYTNGQIMGWFRSEFEKIRGYSDPAMCTGKTLDNGGCLGRETATSMGAYYWTEEMLKVLGITEKLPIASHGLGNAAKYYLLKYYERGYPIISVTDTSGWLSNPYGLDLPDVLAYKQKYGHLAGYSSGKYTVFGDKYSKARKIADEARILNPAAYEDTVDMFIADHLKHVIIMPESANEPCTIGAQRILASRGVYVGPSVITSGGGVEVSLDGEAKQGLDGRKRTAEEIDNQLRTKMTQAFHNVWKFYTDKKLTTLRDAATGYALQQIADRMMVEEDLDAPYGEVIERGIYDVALGKFVE